MANRENGKRITRLDVVGVKFRDFLDTISTSFRKSKMSTNVLPKENCNASSEYWGSIQKEVRKGRLLLD